MEGESDGAFDKPDYILFYGHGPHYWDPTPVVSANNMTFDFKKNFYSDSSFYFITTDLGVGKRITLQASSLIPNTNTVNSFDDHQYHELDGANLIKSGREMYGENFDVINSYSFGLPFPNMINDSARVKVSIAGRNIGAPAVFNVNYSSGSSLISCSGIFSTNYTEPIAIENFMFKSFIANSGAALNVTITKNTSQATGWINYIYANCRRSLIYSNSQLFFRDLRSIGPTSISKFNITSTIAITIWDLTDPFNIVEQQTSISGSQYEFTIATPTLHQLVAFSNTGFLTPNAIGEIPNQNLHALRPGAYVIISHPDFLTQAQSLADLHQTYDTLTSVIVTPQDIYNEFSSGVQDITALRDFVRMLYFRTSTSDSTPKYLLLLGDGSYDNLRRYGSSNTNFIPTYQTYHSLAVTISKTSDDFFGFMDDTEGAMSFADVLDLGVGRLSVSTIADADAVVEKIKNYYKTNPAFNALDDPLAGCNNINDGSMGDWRNWMTLIADDWDAGWESFVADGELFEQYIKLYDMSLNIDKIYLDAFQQQSVPGGERYPDVVDAINSRMEKGSVIVAYSGHGGELGLAHESVIGVSQIQSWSNINRLPLFFTATCEFSRFDDPDRTSAGEFVLLNHNGGGIGLFTTTRLAYKGDGVDLGPKFYTAALSLINGEHPACGDIIRITKNLTGNSYPHFTLLGDPALVLALPKQKVTTSEINSVPIATGVNDTIRALSTVTVKGFISDINGNKLTNFNGIVYPTVYDKPTLRTTLANDGTPGSTFNFREQNNTLYKGKALVTNGDFQFNFVVPKDIAYNFDNGKISYYAQNGITDAGGYYDGIMVGGSDPNAKPDFVGPEVKLFMNDNKFVFGGLTNNTPEVYAEIFDSSGVNTVGNGIGHDLVAIVDAQTNKQILLNDYYQSDLNSYQKGKVRYKLGDLPEGKHTLSLKVWDVQNNSNTAYTEFIVAKSEGLALDHVLNYPNPFTTSTKFFVEHNQCCTTVFIEIQVFTITGKVVKTMNKTINAEGFRTDGIEWDAKDDFGDKLARGVYVYKVSAKTTDGKSANKFEKLVILN